MKTIPHSIFFSNFKERFYRGRRKKAPFVSSLFAAKRSCSKSTLPRSIRNDLLPSLTRAFLFVLLSTFLLFASVAPVMTDALGVLRTGKINDIPFSLEDVPLHSTAVCMRIYLDGEVADLVDLRKNEPVYTASLTKMMTLYTAYRLMQTKGIDPSQTVTAAASDIEGLYAMDASVMGLSAGEILPYKDVLYGLILPSGADAGRLLSRTLAENSAAFINAMNDDALSLGLEASHFTNTSGLFEPDNLSTMSDMATLLHAIYEEPFLREILSTRTYRTKPTNMRPGGYTLTHTIVTTGTLEGIDTSTVEGCKTGSLQESGYCLASFKTIGDALVIITTTGAYRRGDNLRDHNALYGALQNQWPADGLPVALLGAPESAPVETNKPSSSKTEYHEKTTSFFSDAPNEPHSQSSSEKRSAAQIVGIIMAAILLILSLSLLLSLIMRNKREEDERERARWRF